MCWKVVAFHLLEPYRARYHPRRTPRRPPGDSFDGKFVRDCFYVEDGAATYMLLAERLLEGDPQVHGGALNFSNEIQVTVTGTGKSHLEEDGLQAGSGYPQ
jgi:hypothetical protein